MDAHDRHVAIDYAKVAIGLGVLLLGICALIFMLWLMLATPKATAFDADGVRCYARAFSMECIKTAEPAR